MDTTTELLNKLPVLIRRHDGAVLDTEYRLTITRDENPLLWTIKYEAVSGELYRFEDYPDDWVSHSDLAEACKLMLNLTVPKMTQPNFRDDITNDLNLIRKADGEFEFTDVLGRYHKVKVLTVHEDSFEATGVTTNHTSHFMYTAILSFETY